MTWEDLAKSNLAAAKLLHEQGHYRPSVNRSYYAAYCAFTGLFAGDHAREYKHGGNNPAREQLLALVRNNLDKRRFGERVRRQLRRSLYRLLGLRRVADYLPGRGIGEGDSRNAFFMAAGVLKDIELI